MKSSILTLCLAVALPVSLMAHDVLYLTNGTTKLGQIVEYTPSFIVLKRPGTGTVEYISRDQVGQIIQDEDVKKITSFKENESDEGFDKKNVISLNYLEFGVLLNLHLSYERILSDGYLGLALNYAMSMDPISNKGNNYVSNLNYYYINRYSFDINIYPAGQHRVSYFIGPSLIYGTYEYDDEDPLTDVEQLNYTSFLLNNGVVFQLVPNFSMGIKAGLGIVRELDSSGEYQGIRGSTPLIGFNVSLRL